jgi:guanyl-specific ribonuclease Sa
VPYNGRKRLIAISNDGNTPYAVFGGQQSFDNSSERGEIEANVKFSDHNKTISGRQSDSLSFESLAYDIDEADEAQDLLDQIYDAGGIAYVEEGRWDGENQSSYEPLQRNHGYFTEYSRSAEDETAVSLSLSLTLQEKWTKVASGAALSSIAVTPPTSSLIVGGTEQLTVTATYSDATTAVITESAEFGTANAAVATVVSSGLITAESVGSASVYATFGGYSDACDVTVS